MVLWVAVTADFVAPFEVAPTSVSVYREELINALGGFPIVDDTEDNIISHPDAL